MSDKTSPEFDLLGDPWRPLKDQRGRKRHQWSKQVAENVAVLRATGMSIEHVGDRVGLDAKTLSKYYSRELENGPALAQSQVDEVMYQKALSGNVSAARYIRESFGNGKVSRAAAPTKKASSPKEGVKEQKLRAAMGVDGLYATRSPPKSRVQ